MRFLSILMLFLFVVSSIWAETIYLKDGTIITGIIEETTPQNITIKTSYGSVVVNKDRILRIEYAEAAPTEQQSFRGILLNSSVIVHTSIGDIIKGTLTEITSQSLVVSTVYGLVKLEKNQILSIEQEGITTQYEQPQRQVTPVREKVTAKLVPQSRVGFKVSGNYSKLSMSDYNAWAEYQNDEYLEPTNMPTLPYFHHGFEVGGELLFIITRNLQLGIGSGFLLGKGIKYEHSDEYSETGVNYETEIEYTHSAYAIPITASIYPVLPLASNLNFILGGGFGYYISKCNFEERTYFHLESTYYDEWGTSISTFEANLSTGGIGLHGLVGLEVGFSSKIALVIEGKWRLAKISGYKGKGHRSWEYKYWDGYELDEEEESEDVDLELIWAEKDDEKNFGPVSEEDRDEMENYWDEVRDGIIDFSGSSISIAFLIKF